MATPDDEERYEPEAVERIIRRAMHIESEQAISRDDLREAAREAGIAPEAIDRAIDEEAGQIAADRRQRKRQQRQRSSFRHQLATSVVLVGFLFLVTKAHVYFVQQHHLAPPQKAPWVCALIALHPDLDQCLLSVVLGLLLVRCLVEGDGKEIGPQLLESLALLARPVEPGRGM